MNRMIPIILVVVSVTVLILAANVLWQAKMMKDHSAWISDVRAEGFKNQKQIKALEERLDTIDEGHVLLLADVLPNLVKLSELNRESILELQLKQIELRINQLRD